MQKYHHFRSTKTVKNRAIDLLILAIIVVGVAKLSSGANAAEPIRLESIIVGDKEQPSVSYFVPWQGVSGPDQMHRGIENRFDRSLSKVDREVLLRTKGIYEEMNLENK